MTREQRKAALIARSYGVGEIEVALIVGEYPPPYFLPGCACTPEALWWYGRCTCHDEPDGEGS